MTDENTDENITHETLPGHDEPASAANNGRRVFDPLAEGNPLRVDIELRERIVLLENAVQGHRQVLALLTTATIILTIALAVRAFKGTRAA